jgi:hypothetical protein
MTLSIEPIGVVRNGVTEARDEEWGRVVSEIQLRPDLADVPEWMERLMEGYF